MANSFQKQTGFYQSRSFIKWFIIISSVVIGGFSILSTNLLVENLKEREKRLIDLYASTIEYAFSESDVSDIAFIAEKIIFANNSIPVILADENRNPIDTRNLEIPNDLDPEQREDFLKSQMHQMEENFDPIEISFTGGEGKTLYNYVYYRNSRLLTLLRYYPYLQLSVIAIFGLIVFLAFSYSKTAEQNRVWAGMAKETAHQLGTPISSLMAWMEILKGDTDMDRHEIYSELQKDIERLQVITERFSNIGSTPNLLNHNLYQVTDEAVGYIRRRISKKIDVEVVANPDHIEAKINKSLYEWVMENLVKNAADAIGKEGNILITITAHGEKEAAIDVSDSGKGIPRSKLKEVFQPGFSSKKRGWGLGLTLVKRIIEHYHNGKIFIQSSEIGKGTTFRILLQRENDQAGKT